MKILESHDKSLPETLEYTGEFGPELVLCLPFFNWLSRSGVLSNRRIVTYTGMRCFYDDLVCREIIEKPDARSYLRPDQRPPWLPVRNEHDFDIGEQSPQHLYPDLRRKFGKIQMIPIVGETDRPLLIIHNKHNNEWNSGPVNHISIDTLNIIFRLLKKDFTIVYIRHGIGVTVDGFVDDHNVTMPFNDRWLLDNHPEVICFDDLYEKHKKEGGTQDINTFKNVLYSRCYRFISSQGGGAHQIALFSGCLLIVLHRRGSEETWAYGDGYYKFMATPAPVLAVCRTDDDLLSSLILLVNSVVVNGNILLSAESGKRLEYLSPYTIAQRRS